MGGIVGCGVERYPTCLRLSESIKHICLLTPPLPIRYSRLSRIHLPTSSTYYLPREGGSAHCQIVLHAHEQIRSRGPPHSQHPASLSSGVVMSITIYVQAFPGAPNPGFVFLSVGMRQSRRRRCCMSWLSKQYKVLAPKDQLRYYGHYPWRKVMAKCKVDKRKGEVRRSEEGRQGAWKGCYSPYVTCGGDRAVEIKECGT